jgi:hypothetical protein
VYVKKIADGYFWEIGNVEISFPFLMREATQRASESKFLENEKKEK